MQPGTRLGPYEIVSPIGAGGMGEVWKARDTRLDRNVAIKILSSHFAGNAQLRLRFEREAKTISQLQHPNICTLFDVGEDYLVMELLEGESLAERLTRGPLVLDDVMKFGSQIAEALDKAHRAGVVHRDLKPGNIMLTKSGAKLLDFGLAKSSAIEVNLDGATMQRPLTQEGTILGTFQYMAPEQLEGSEVDARTDIFSFGAVLYEMATGKRAFEGKTKTSLIAAIVKEQPRPIHELQPLTPPALEHIVAKCLEKEPGDRWQSAHDVASELRWIASSGSSTIVAAMPHLRRRTLRTFAATALGLIAGVVIGAYALRAWESRQRMSLRLSFTTPDGINLAPASGGGAAVLSPDGRSVVFVGRDAGVNRLYVRRLDELEPKPLALTEGASYPFWSGDGQSIAFFADGKLKRTDLRGTPPKAIIDCADGRGGAWLNGTIIFAPQIGSPLMAVSVEGGAKRQLTQFPPGTRSHRFPSAFPDGDHYLFYTQGNDDRRGVWIGSLTSGKTKRLVDTRTAGVVSGDDTIIYARDGVLLSQQVDLKNLALRGDDKPVAQKVTVAGDRNVSILSAANGAILFQSGGTERATFSWIDRSGKRSPFPGEPDEYEEPTFAARELRVVASHTATDSPRSIDVATGQTTRLSFLNETYSTSAATPDGTSIVSSALIDGKQSLVEFASGKPRRLIAQYKKAKYPDYFDRSGDLLVVEGERDDGRGDFDVYLARRSRGFALEPLLDSVSNESHGQLSPDGKFIAYSGDESGRSEIYVQPVPPTGERWQLSSNGGDQAQWGADEKELFYLTLDARIMSVSIRSLAPFQMGEAAAVVSTKISPASMLGNRNQYLVTSDARRFLVLEPVESPHANELRVITNWK